ncbi:protein lethal(2)essential for life-like [Sabethes cyaneus]|uniref:protein lethal(2)essential for life-like n=1 Tax=Sabethes cyaneus TaxID=53552 RepID=UPI00237E20B1|nr:protein lethal(2)essential for life-like [Sabethes cyaneus]
MSLVPVFLREWCDDIRGAPPRPSRILERFFGEDIFPDELLVAVDHVPKRRAQKRPWHLSGLGTPEDNHAIVKQTKEGFQVNVDVQQFTPEEISVKLADNFITIEGKHEEKQDGKGFVWRHFVRKYQLPEGYDADRMVSSLSSDGMLTVKAPKLALPAAEGERTIPIVRTKGKAAIKDDHKNGK